MRSAERSHLFHRSGQVAAEIQQGAAAGPCGPCSGRNRSNRGSKTVSAPSDPLSRSSRTVREVRVPAAVLVHGQRDVELLGQADYPAGRISIRHERLVADDRQAQTQHLLGERDVGGDRRGDRHRLGSCAGQVRQRGEDRTAEVLGDLAAALG
jgi:hypothetical protein